MEKLIAIAALGTLIGCSSTKTDVPNSDPVADTMPTPSVACYAGIVYFYFPTIEHMTVAWGSDGKPIQCKIKPAAAEIIHDPEAQPGSEENTDTHK